ncbi:hypothetical protein bmyco0002_49960 [Bacillus pseudomycoides]|nr:hypothetical protein bmyco0002_49960 [Bacillus pseudomycoides]
MFAFLYFINKIDKECLCMNQLTFLPKIDRKATHARLEKILEDIDSLG